VAAPAAAPSNQISPERPGNIRYRDRRLIALYFDMTSMPEADQIRALGAAQKFIASQIKPADLVSIMEYASGAVKVVLDFTDDREKLLTAINTLIIGEDDGMGGTTQDASSADTGAAFGQDDSEFNLFTTDRQLSALQTAVNMLKSLNEQKSLVYFASGLRLNGINNQAQLHATVNAAIRANVAFFPVDARGLVARPPLGDATQGAPGGLAMYNGAAFRAGMDSFQRSQDTLYTLAGDTGGKAMLDTNDLASGIVAAEQAISSYYILGYYTTNPNLDGKLRRVKITLKEIPAKLTYREG
jgi:VWFA-related protein